jgi:hypothetical protein
MGSFVFVSLIFKIEMFAVYMSCFKTLNPVHFLQFTYMFYVFFKITVVISANSINWLAFVIEVQCVCCEVGTKFLCVIYMNPMLQSVKLLSSISLLRNHIPYTKNTG